MKVLFVKLGAIGDALMARSLPLALKQARPQARLTWMAGAGIAPLVRCFPGVDEVLAVDDAALLAGGPASRARALLGAWAGLGLRRFDRVLVGHADWRWGLPALTAWGPRRRFRAGVLPRPGRYHGDEYVRLLEGGDAAALQRPPLPPLKVAPSSALAARLRGRGRLLLLFPGGARNLLRDDGLRRWPLESYAALARLAARRGWRVALGGGPGDAWCRPAFKGLDAGLDLIGACDLPQTLALCGRADHVVTHDSGPLHLALAAGARVTALFGPTQPHEKVDPRAGATVLWGGEGLACRPCYDGRSYADCADPVCLRAVSPQAVLEGLEA